MKKTRILLLFFFVAMVLILFIPQRVIVPVKGATSRDWHPNSFWFYPWGKSGTHKGIDIFAKEGTPVLSASSGFVIYKGSLKMGGNAVIILGPQWRFYYYAHLKDILINKRIVRQGELLGTVGTTGNARGKAPHLHFTIATLIPYIWRWDTEVQGWKKIFYLNPLDYIPDK